MQKIRSCQQNTHSINFLLLIAELYDVGISNFKYVGFFAKEEEVFILVD